MDDELVLLTSYFNLVDGRRQDSADTFRVDTDLPDGSASSGTAALYVVTEASSASPTGPRSRRLAADTIAWEYGRRHDEPPATRLKEALQAAHDEVRREFEGHVTVGATVMAVERDSVYLAQVPPAQVYVVHDSGLNSIPASVEGSSPFARALGGSEPPRISVFRDQIAHGDVLALCSTWFDYAADASDLRECFAAGTADEIAEALLELAQQHDGRAATAIVIEAALAKELEATPNGDETPGLMEQVDIAVQALAGVGRMLLEELRPVPQDADGTMEPERETVLAGITTESPIIEPRPRASVPVEQSTQEHAIVPTVGPEGGDREPLGGAGTGGWDDGLLVEDDDFAHPPRNGWSSSGDRLETESLPGQRPEPELDWRVPEPASEPRPRSARDELTEELPAVQPHQSPTELEQVNSRLKGDIDMAEIIPPIQAFEDTSVEPARIYPTSKDIDAVNRRPRRFGGVPSVPVIRPGLGDIDLRQRVTRPTPSWMMWASLAVLLVLVAGAAFLYMRHHLRAATPPYLSFVQTDLKRATSASKPATQTYYLHRAGVNLSAAAKSGTPAKQVTYWRGRITSVSDGIYHITRETNPVLITNFARYPGAKPTGIATAPGLVYVVDPARKSVFSVSTLPNSSPTEIFQAGDVYSGFTVDVPRFIATDGTTLVALDDKNVLVRDTAGTKTATTLTAQTPKPGNYAALTVSDPDVYLLDTANSQVWRYPYAVSGYNPTQAAYWDTSPPKLGNATSFAFDKSDMYILLRSGTVLRYDYQASPQPFTLNLKTPLNNPVALYTDANQKYVWIADPANGRILQLGKDGTYDHEYLSSSGMNFHTVRSIAAGPSGNTLYVLTASKLYSFSIVS